MVTGLSLSLTQIHFNCDRNEESATKEKEKFPRESTTHYLDPKKGKDLGFLSHLPGLNTHARAANERFIAAFGSCRDMVS